MYIVQLPCSFILLLEEFNQDKLVVITVTSLSRHRYRTKLEVPHPIHRQNPGASHIAREGSCDFQEQPGCRNENPHFVWSTMTASASTWITRYVDTI